MTRGATGTALADLLSARLLEGDLQAFDGTFRAFLNDIRESEQRTSPERYAQTFHQFWVLAETDREQLQKTVEKADHFGVLSSENVDAMIDVLSALFPRKA